MRSKFKFTNRILSLVLALVMVVGLLPMTAVPAYAATESPCSGDHTGWTELSSLTETVGGCYEIENGGKYYLSDDVRNTTNYRPTIRITCTEEVTLCLNGKTVYHAQSPSAQVISLSDGSTLNLCDCVGTGCIVGEKEILFAYSGATINMYSGTLKDSVKEAVYLLADASFNMYGGTITGCNTKYEDAAIISYSSAQINIYGGNISGNHKYGISSEGSIYIAGDAKITGNDEGDVYLHEGQIITVGKLTWGADIGVTSAVSGDDIAITGSNTADYSQYFHADNSSYGITNKENKIYLHKHSCTYSATENTITQRCSVGNNHTATATLTATDAVYTGSAITDTATVSYSGDAWSGDDPALSFENNVNVGTATAKMTAGGATASTTFTINPANISGATVTLNPIGGTYTGTAYDPAVSVTLDGFGTLAEGTDYTLSWDKTGFTNADTYTVTVTGKGNFEGTKNWKFTINAAELSDIKVEQVGTLTYTGAAQTPIVSASAVAVNNQPITFTYSTEREGSYSAEIPSFTNVSMVHAVYYKATADNHNTYYGVFLVEIAKATVTVPTIASKVYNGSVQTADVADTDLYTVVKNEGGTGVKENGYYDVVLELKDPANYKWSTTSNAQVTLQFAITRAENEWTVDPSITGWTYGEAAKAPVGEAEFGEVSVEYSGTTNGGAAYNSVAAPTEAGSYTATFIVQETENYKGLETSVDFTVAKAAQEAPTGIGKEEETIFGRNDGIILNLNTSMEYRKEGETTYSPCTGNRVIDRAPGTYYVRYKGSDNYVPSPDTAVTIAAGRKLQIVVPQNQVGYTVTVNKTEMEYEGTYTLKVEIHEGYTATENFKIIITNWECGQQPNVEETYMNAIADQIIEVQGVADITSPDVEIKIENNKWSNFWNDLTFGLFFNETQDVTITASDNGSGVNTIQYHLAGGELSEAEVAQITEWEDYNGTFKIDPNNRYVVYARVTDNAGNILYINSDGIVLDNIAPTLEGIEDGQTYYGDLTVIKSDEQFYDIKTVTLDGEPMGFAEGTYGLIPADNAKHIVVVEDHAGNKTTYTVTVYKNYTVTFKADGDTVATQTVGYGKNATLPAIPAKEGFVGKWDAEGKNITKDTTIRVVYTEIPAATPDEVEPEDVSDLEDAIDDSDNALEVIGNVAAVEQLIAKLPQSITLNDEEAIKAADDAYNALSDYEKSLVDEAAKKALTDAKAALAELNMPVETDGSASGSKCELWLWLLLLLICIVVIILIIVGKKRKKEEK